jgi:hypothetical protein
MMWLLKSPLNLWLITIEFWSSGDFKSRIIIEGTQKWQKSDFYNYSPPPNP